MHKRTKLLFIALVSVFVASVTAGSATANRSIRIAGGPNVSASARLTLFGAGEGRAREITCDVTLLRTIGSVIPKTAGTLFGKVTGVAINRGTATRSERCTHGEFIRDVTDIVPLTATGVAATHRELGGGVLLYDVSRAEARLWKLIYDSFQGTLPNIEGINFHIQRVQFRENVLDPFGFAQECLYEGDGYGLIRISAGVIERATAVPSRTRLARIRGTFACPGEGSFEGTFTVSPRLTITLQ